MTNNTWVAICEDVIGFYGIPTNTIKSFFEKRKKLLDDVILAEIRQGDFSRVHEDDKIAICFRLIRDTIEGTAKNNLRLMARLICGLNTKNRLTATTFQKYEKILADLEPEEIEIISGIVKKYYELPAKNEANYEKAKHQLIDSFLLDKFGDPKSKDTKKYSENYTRMIQLERTGFILRHGGGFAYHDDGIYGSPFSITSFFEEFIEFCPNWQDLATDSGEVA